VCNCQRLSPSHLRGGLKVGLTSVPGTLLSAGLVNTRELVGEGHFMVVSYRAVVAVPSRLRTFSPKSIPPLLRESLNFGEKCAARFPNPPHVGLVCCFGKGRANKARREPFWTTSP